MEYSMCSFQASHADPGSVCFYMSPLQRALIKVVHALSTPCRWPYSCMIDRAPWPVPTLCLGQMALEALSTSDIGRSHALQAAAWSKCMLRGAPPQLSPG